MALRVLALWLASRLGPGSAPFALDIGFWTFVAAIALGTVAGLVGAIIVARRPGNAVGWLYVLTGVLEGVITAGLAYAGLTLVSDPDALGVSMAWANGVVDYAIPFSFAALVLSLFPDGRLVGPRWRVVVVLAVIGGLVRAVEVGFGAPSMVLVIGSVNPYRAAGLAGQILAVSSALGIGSLLVETAAVLAAASLAVRYRSSSLDGRRQIRWLLLAGLLALLSSVPLLYGTLVPGALPPRFDALALTFVALSLAPIATLIAITRYRLYEIDRIVNRALVYGSLTAILAGVFTAAIAFAQRLFVALTGEKSDAAIVLTTLVVATLYAPLRKRLETIVDRRFKFERMLFGAYRDDIARVLGVVEPRRAAARFVEEAVRELGATGGAVLDSGGRATATAGAWPVEPALWLRLHNGAGPLASLAVGPRKDGRPFDPRVTAELQEVAQLAVEGASLYTGTPD